MKAGHSKRIVFRDNLLRRAIFERPSQADRVFTYSYDAIGRPETITYPVSTGIVAKFEDDSATANSGFDANGNLLHLRYEKGGTLIRRFEWTYDDSNNRQSQLEVTPTKAIQWEYGFSWFDQLISVKRAEATTVAGLPATALQREYVFDESDNRKFFDDHVNSKTYHYKYKSIDDNGTTRYSDQLEEILTSTTVGDRVLANFTSLETFEHDLDGNMTKRIKTGEEISFQWSDYDRLLRVESDTTGRKQDNRYDVNGIRKRKLDINGSSSREYTAGIATSTSRADLGSTSVPTISYLMVGGAIVGYEEDDGTTSEFRFFLTDHLSSVRDIVDDTGAVIRSYEFGEYGNELSSSGTGTNPEKTWVGGLSVNDDRADSGLWLMGHRHYLGEHIGRFISRDPIGFDGGMNLYNYPTNPVNFVDPTGLDAFLGVKGTPEIRVKTAYELANALSKISDGTLESLILAGHGSSTFQGLNIDEQTIEGIYQRRNGEVILSGVTPPGQNDSGLLDYNGDPAQDGQVFYLPLKEALKNKFEKTGRPLLGLHGCNVGSGDDNITKSTSAQIKGVIVEGAPLFSLGIKGSGRSPLAFGGRKTYLNGKHLTNRRAPYNPPRPDNRTRGARH